MEQEWCLCPVSARGQLNCSKPVPEARQVPVCGYLLSATLTVFSPAPQELFQQQGSAHIHQVYLFSAPDGCALVIIQVEKMHQDV